MCIVQTAVSVCSAYVQSVVYSVRVHYVVCRARVQCFVFSVKCIQVKYNFALTDFFFL